MPSLGGVIGCGVLVVGCPLSVVGSEVEARVSGAGVGGVAVDALEGVGSSVFASVVSPVDCNPSSVAKSFSVKPRCSKTAIANASPITNAAVVLEVGARPSGQASFSTLTSM